VLQQFVLLYNFRFFGETKKITFLLMMISSFFKQEGVFFPHELQMFSVLNLMIGRLLERILNMHVLSGFMMSVSEQVSIIPWQTNIWKYLNMLWRREYGMKILFKLAKYT
jgi:hypothetical protein